MPSQFAHSGFQHFEFEQVPLDRDVFLMDESWIADWESAYLDLFEGQPFRNVGYISYAAVRQASIDALEISWYPNIMDRFHEVSVLLPRAAFVACVDVYDYDEKPHIFVKSQWLTGIHLRPYSAFALVDVIGVKNALRGGGLSGAKLIALRDRIDLLADATPGVAFVSFADSLLLKANWFVGQHDSEVNYSYEPETLIRLIPQVAAIYQDVLGMSVYATITQGVNEYEDKSLIHRSTAGGHVSLNSLGLPFAQLLAIDEAARGAIRSKEHFPFELYVDEMFFHSLRFKYGFDKHAQPSAPYIAPMSSTPGKYYCTTAQVLLENLDSSPSPIRSRKR
ncbi:hypothetical protein LNV09_24490 [Paucibacter sp. B2R-40]|uniref:hypothetical protein n=1 Tax=Paucibacter sp. B2R-40 TaxID=2893554 RepID=UPI0021E48D02|nr:hypothetical protein [Paucibacter sp. B2R-40]MCV2357316.1 hypothetical protein [Paucibacter sp. B2R-40]